MKYLSSCDHYDERYSWLNYYGNSTGEDETKENVEKIEGMSGSESLTRFLRVQKTK